MSDTELTTGWIVCVKSRSGEERLFLVAEPVQLTALEIAKEKVPVRESDDLTLGLSVSSEELARRGLNPGDVAPHDAARAIECDRQSDDAP